MASNFQTLDILDLMPNKLKIFPIQFALDLQTKFPLGNMSIVQLDNGNYILSIRQFNYYLLTANGLGYHHFNNENFLNDRSNYFVEVDQNFKFVKKLSIQIDPIALIFMEDIRLIKFGDKWQMSGTFIKNGIPQAFIFECDFDGNTFTKLEQLFIVTSNVPEKNWIPIEHIKGVFIKNIQDGKIEIADLQQKKISGKYCIGAKPIRGSTQLVRLNEKWFGIGHTKETICKVKQKDVFQFYFNLYEFSNDFSQCKISAPFTCFHECISFTCGMTINNGILTLPVTLNDQTSYVLQMPLDALIDYIGFKGV